jgi:hypothetical protein
MATAAAASGATGQTVDARFIDLVCADADLLAAEFAAIITAEWPEPPARKTGRSAAGGQPWSDAVRGRAKVDGDRRDRPRHPGVGGWARQRSPPYRRPKHDRQERQVIAPREPSLTR